MLQDIWSNSSLFSSLLVIIEEDLTQILLVIYQGFRAIIIGV